MKTLLYFFMVLAACGLALSVIAHIMALTGTAVPGGKLVWGLHVGIFVVWIPTILTSKEMTRHASRKDFWKVALAGCPGWMRRGFYVLLGYAALNFIVFFVNTAGQPKQHMNEAAPPSVVKGFSGHWMVFYAAAFALLYSRIHAPGLYRERLCPNGHTSAPAARFCPECGHEFPQETGRVV